MLFEVYYILCNCLLYGTIADHAIILSGMHHKQNSNPSILPISPISKKPIIYMSIKYSFIGQFLIKLLSIRWCYCFVWGYIYNVSSYFFSKSDYSTFTHTLLFENYASLTQCYCQLTFHSHNISSSPRAS